ncbi:MAG: hypothetical protein ABWX73_14945 [Marmoricola sp.]
MTESREAGESRRGISRARALVRRTNGRQRLGAGVAAALLVTAPFGGLEAAEAPGPAPLVPGKSFEVGPYDVTIRKAVTVADLAPSIKPEQEGGRLLVLVGTVTNPGDRPEFATLLTNAFTLKGGDVVVPDGGRSAGRLVSVEDGQGISTINPGLTYDVAIVFEQEPGWTEQPVTVEVDGYEYLEEDPLTLDPKSWLDTDEVVRSGRFDVETRR